MLSIRRVRGRDRTALMNHGDGGKVELIRVGGMRSFGLVEGAQTVNVVPAGPTECEGRRGTALDTSGGFFRGIPSLFASIVILRPRGAAGLGD